eukprot:213989_1
MPELAEVEKVRHLIESTTLNKTIIKVKAIEDDIVFMNKKPKEIEKSLLNSRVLNVCRKGKIFWMELDSPPHISFHLGMTGRMIVRGKSILTYYRYPDKNEQNSWPPRFHKLLLTFNDNTQISFCNTRRLGRVRLHTDLPSLEEPIISLGYDPYNSMCNYNTFSDLILARKCPLKALLLKQSFTAGVGNWIADEVCYQSGIYPGIYCNKLNNLQIKRIYNSLKSIVKYAVSVSANYNMFPSNWLFHYRWNKGKGNKKNKKEKDLNNYSDAFGNEIIYEQIGGRTTAVVLKLQSKLNGYRMFKNHKKLGKIECYQKKLEMRKKNKYKLIDDDG